MNYKDKIVAVVDPNHQYLGFMGKVVEDNTGQLKISTLDLDLIINADYNQIEIVDDSYLA